MQKLLKVCNLLFPPDRQVPVLPIFTLIVHWTGSPWLQEGQRKPPQRRSKEAILHIKKERCFWNLWRRECTMYALTYFETASKTVNFEFLCHFTISVVLDQHANIEPHLQ